MSNDLKKTLLDKYFDLMGLLVISYGQVNDIALGIIIGIHENIEDFSEHMYFFWRSNKSDDELNDIIILCNLLKSNNLVDTDKIIIPENKLFEVMKVTTWDLQKRHRVLDDLLSLKVRMIYDGEDKDWFFLHF